MKDSIIFRAARIDDLHVLVELLQDDELGESRESPLDFSPYEPALAAIVHDPLHQILILELDEKIIGCLQISYLPNLTFKGAWRALFEGVRIRSSYRQKGFGKKLIEEAIKISKNFGCQIIQLTTNHSRQEAVAFYKKLGFEDSHVGMKLYLTS